MKKFEEILADVKKTINAQITSESSAEEIEKVKAIQGELDSLGESHKAVVEESIKIKDLYINSINNFGTKDSGSSENKKGRSMEEIANEILAREKGK